MTYKGILIILIILTTILFESFVICISQNNRSQKLGLSLNILVSTCILIKCKGHIKFLFNISSSPLQFQYKILQLKDQSPFLQKRKQRLGKMLQEKTMGKSCSNAGIRYCGGKRCYQMLRDNIKTGLLHKIKGNRLQEKTVGKS